MESLNCKSLMIGDWLYSIIHNHPDKIVKVTGIRTDCDTVVIQCNDTDVWYPLDTYKPIPLTKEILEKNGWSQDLYSNESYNNEDAEQLSLWIGEDSNDWWWHVGVELVTPINYVHQLQHALRLCGINKEIQV